jgi:hypothetical protein
VYKRTSPGQFKKKKNKTKTKTKKLKPRLFANMIIHRKSKRT